MELTIILSAIAAVLLSLFVASRQRPAAMTATRQTYANMGRLPISAARQYAMEMEEGRKAWPIIGGYQLFTAEVRIFPATEVDGRVYSLEVRQLTVVYQSGRAETYEFDAGGNLLYHVAPYEE